MQSLKYTDGRCQAHRLPAAGQRVATASVDVVIAARDRADTIARAVKSALGQPEVCRVLLIDDGSIDDTAIRAAECDLHSKRLVIQHLNTSVGPSAARNIALEISDSPWVAILDGDDYFLPGRIRHLLSWSDKCDFIADALLQIPESASNCDRAVVGRSGTPQLVDLSNFVRGNISRPGKLRQELGFVKPLMRRSFLYEHGLKYDEELRLGEDYALYARALAAGARFLLIQEAGYVSVVRPESLSAKHSKRDLERLRDSDTQLIKRKTLSQLERRAINAHYVSIDCRVQWLAVIEAFKSKNIRGFLAPLCRSPKVSLYIVMRLFDEVCRRTKRRLLGTNSQQRRKP
jgi:succinoglycan biosynthesis protein ExoU